MSTSIHPQANRPQNQQIPTGMRTSTRGFRNSCGPSSRTGIPPAEWTPRRWETNRPAMSNPTPVTCVQPTSQVTSECVFCGDQTRHLTSSTCETRKEVRLDWRIWATHASSMQVKRYAPRLPRSPLTPFSSSICLRRIGLQALLHTPGLIGFFADMNARLHSHLKSLYVMSVSAGGLSCRLVSL